MMHYIISLINYKGVCRTAPATRGLLIIRKWPHFVESLLMAIGEPVWWLLCQLYSRVSQQTPHVMMALLPTIF